MMSTRRGTTLDWFRFETDCLSALRLMLSPDWCASIRAATMSVQHRIVISDWGAVGGARGAPMLSVVGWCG